MIVAGYGFLGRPIDKELPRFVVELEYERHRRADAHRLFRIRYRQAEKRLDSIIKEVKRECIFPREIFRSTARSVD